MPFTVLVGRNGSGKSTLTEALQWLDVAIRRDIREASDRYCGLYDLINLRQRRANPYFQLRLRWESQKDEAAPLKYQVRIEESSASVPMVASERLETEGHENEPLVWTGEQGLRLIRRRGSGQKAGETAQEPEAISVERSDELALRYARHELRQLGLIDEFWSRAVFLRLSPRRIGQGSPAMRKSFEPILDEEGFALPALLNELKAEQLKELVNQIGDLLPGIEGLMVAHAAPGRDTPMYYSLHERVVLPSGGTMYPVPIPAWALSDGTRRLTAILALLLRDPPPSFLCIEEIENGLDPWTVQVVLQYLQAAVERGTQVILTTHSPWVLDAVPLNSIVQVRRVGGDVVFEHFASRPEIQAFDASVPAGTRYVQRGKD